MIRVALIEEESAAAQEVLRRWSLPADALLGPRKRSLLARAALRGLLAATAGMAPGGWRFAAGASRRPLVWRTDGGSAPSISLSHSGGWAACAASEAGPVGIDIEIHRPRRDIQGMAEAAFGAAECRQALSGGIPAFYRIWTLREALAKARGAGLAQAADRIDRVAGFERGAGLADIGGERWWLAHINPVQGVSLALAVLPHAASQFRDAAPLWQWYLLSPVQYPLSPIPGCILEGPGLTYPAARGAGNFQFTVR